MQIDINQAKGLCRLWVPGEDKNTYKNSSEYRKAIEKCRRLNLNACVYVGGQQPLLPTISTLLEGQNTQSRLSNIR